MWLIIIDVSHISLPLLLGLKQAHHKYSNNAKKYMTLTFRLFFLALALAVLFHK